MNCRWLQWCVRIKAYHSVQYNTDKNNYKLIALLRKLLGWLSLARANVQLSPGQQHIRSTNTIAEIGMESSVKWVTNQSISNYFFFGEYMNYWRALKTDAIRIQKSWWCVGTHFWLELFPFLTRYTETRRKRTESCCCCLWVVDVEADEAGEVVVAVYAIENCYKQQQQWAKKNWLDTWGAVWEENEKKNGL